MIHSAITSMVFNCTGSIETKTFLAIFYQHHASQSKQCVIKQPVCWTHPSCTQVSLCKVCRIFCGSHGHKSFNPAVRKLPLTWFGKGEGNGMKIIENHRWWLKQVQHGESLFFLPGHAACIVPSVRMERGSCEINNLCCTSVGWRQKDTQAAQGHPLLLRTGDFFPRQLLLLMLHNYHILFYSTEVLLTRPVYSYIFWSILNNHLSSTALHWHWNPEPEPGHPSNVTGREVEDWPATVNLVSAPRSVAANSFPHRHVLRPKKP